MSRLDYRMADCSRCWCEPGSSTYSMPAECTARKPAAGAAPDHDSGELSARFFTRLGALYPVGNFVACRKLSQAEVDVGNSEVDGRLKVPRTPLSVVVMYGPYFGYQMSHTCGTAVVKILKQVIPTAQEVVIRFVPAMERRYMPPSFEECIDVTSSIRRILLQNAFPRLSEVGLRLWNQRVLGIHGHTLVDALPELHKSGMLRIDMVSAASIHGGVVHSPTHVEKHDDNYHFFRYLVLGRMPGEDLQEKWPGP